MSTETKPPELTKDDFVSSSEVRWCPGCGDYAILSVVQRTLPKFGIKPENHVFVSGIGCSSRFPYYMNTYGFHTIHGRAPTFATGLKCVRPDLHVWVVTGDGDGLSIGGNHLIHAMRRNVNMTILLFNNRIYGLTKGQYSPTSEMGKRTASTPMGSIDYPINPLCIALASEATFVARTLDTDIKHLGYVLERAARHKARAARNLVECGHHHIAPSLESLTERADHVLLRAGQRRERGVLADRRGIGGGVALQAVNRLGDFRRRRQIPDAPAGHRIRFGDAADDDGARVELAAQGRHRMLFVRRKHEVFVNLIAQHQQRGMR